jgi:hypothetical protein
MIKKVPDSLILFWQPECSSAYSQKPRLCTHVLSCLDPVHNFGASVFSVLILYSVYAGVSRGRFTWGFPTNILYIVRLYLYRACYIPFPFFLVRSLKYGHQPGPIIRCSSRSSVSEEHLMGPSMSVCRGVPPRVGNLHYQRGRCHSCATMGSEAPLLEECFFFRKLVKYGPWNDWPCVLTWRTLLIIRPFACFLT